MRTLLRPAYFFTPVQHDLAPTAIAGLVVLVVVVLVRVLGSDGLRSSRRRPSRRVVVVVVVVIEPSPIRPFTDSVYLRALQFVRSLFEAFLVVRVVNTNNTS